MRLLYVALTRAESWLIICGAGTRKSERSWYNLIKGALVSLNASKNDFKDIGEGLLFKDNNWESLSVKEKSSELEHQKKYLSQMVNGKCKKN